MSRIIEHNNQTWTGVPYEYVGMRGTSTSNPSNVANGLKSANTTDYSSAQQAVSGITHYVYRFNITGIPDNATINSVSCQIKVRTSNANGTSNCSTQLYTGTSPKGTAIDFTNNTSTSIRTFTDCGTWTAEEINNLYLYVSGQRSSSRYIYFYGADLTINYSYTETEYEVTTSSTSQTASISPASQYVSEGNDVTLTITNITDVTEIGVEDNGDNVTSELVHVSGTTYTYTIENISADHSILIKDVPSVYITVTNNTGLITSISPASGSVNKVGQGDDLLIAIHTDDITHINIFDDDVKNNVTEINHVMETTSGVFAVASNGESTIDRTTNPNNGNSDSSSTYRAILQPSASSVQHIKYWFDCSDIPANSEIISLSCKYKACVSNTNFTTGSVRLYSGSTTKSNANTSGKSTTTASVFSLSGIDTFTRAELDDLYLYIEVRAKSSSQSYYFYGADVTIEYTYEGDVYYMYTAVGNKTKTVRFETRPTYQITASTSVSETSITPTSETAWEGHDLSFNLTIPDLSAVNVLDNNVNINNLLTGTSPNYIYNLTNIQAAHNITITEIASENKLYIKLNNVYIEASHVYMKSSGSWSEVNDLTTLLSLNKVIIWNG